MVVRNKFELFSGLLLTQTITIIEINTQESEMINFGLMNDLRRAFKRCLDGGKLLIVSSVKTVGEEFK